MRTRAAAWTARARRPAGRGGLPCVWLVVALVGVVGATGCKDVVGPDGVEGAYALRSIGGVSIPASFVDGTCWGCAEGCGLYPDQKYVLAGELELRDGEYRLSYSWKGETPACCAWGPRKGPTWVKTSSGRYTLSGSTVLLVETNGSFAASWVAEDVIEVPDWGQLRRLRYERR